MTNEQNYKTAEERIKAFGEFCGGRGCANCILKDTPVGPGSCTFLWLALEAEEEKPMPCPFCGGKMQLMFEQNNDTHCLVCNGRCGYTTGAYSSETKAVTWHNRVCRAVKAAKKGEVK